MARIAVASTLSDASTLESIVGPGALESVLPEIAGDAAAPTLVPLAVVGVADFTAPAVVALLDGAEFDGVAVFGAGGAGAVGEGAVDGGGDETMAVPIEIVTTG